MSLKAFVCLALAASTYALPMQDRSLSRLERRILESRDPVCATVNKRQMNDAGISRRVVDIVTTSSVCKPLGDIFVTELLYWPENNPCSQCSFYSDKNCKEEIQTLHRGQDSQDKEFSKPANSYICS